MKIASADPEKPLVTVIIPAHNEEAHIAKCIASVRDSGWPPEQLDILVIDHRSTDSTATVARAAGARVIRLEAGTIGAVRNAGLRGASGEFVAYVDADCTVPVTWLHTGMSYLQANSQIGAVGGPCLSPENGTWIERSLAPSHPGPHRHKEAKTLATSSFISRTATLIETGLFDETLVSGEDDDMSLRIRRKGLTLISTSACHIVHHGYPRGWYDVIRKEIWHGSNHVDVRSDGDLTLLLTHMFILAFIAGPLLLGAALYTRTDHFLYALSTDIAAQLAPPVLFATKRLRSSPRDWLLFPCLLAVGYAYFLGHGLGVLSNYLRRLETAIFGSVTPAGRKLE